MTSAAQATARSALVAVAVLLVPGERAESVAQGSYDNAPGLIVLTDRRLLVINQLDWAPSCTWFSVDAGLTVQAWEDASGATVVLTGEGRSATVTAIVDKPPAYDLVARIRLRTGR